MKIFTVTLTLSRKIVTYKIICERAAQAVKHAYELNGGDYAIEKFDVDEGKPIPEPFTLRIDTEDLVEAKPKY